MTKDEKQLIELFLRDPQSDAKLEFVSPLVQNADGTSSFVVGRADQDERFRVTFKIEEIYAEDSTGAEVFTEYNEALDWAAKWLTDQANGDPQKRAFAQNVAGSFLSHKKPWKK